MKNVKVQPLRNVKERGNQKGMEIDEKKRHGEEGEADLSEPEGKKGLKGNGAKQGGKKLYPKSQVKTSISFKG